MRILPVLSIAAALTFANANAEVHASEAIDAYNKMMATDDATAKRDAVKNLASKSAGSDDEVLPLLVAAVADRQTNEAAIGALRSRTGLQPASRVGQSHYPSYPSGDKAGDWSTWLAERSREKEQEKQVKEAEKTAKEAKKTADKAKKDAEKKTEGDNPKGEGEASGSGDTGDSGDKAAKGDKTKKGDKGDPEAAATDGTDAPKVKRVPGPPPEDLGKLDRVIFKNGSNLVCYILTRRTDADGNLLSVRIVHPDGSGEETLAAAMIARIEEDVK